MNSNKAIKEWNRIYRKSGFNRGDHFFGGDSGKVLTKFFRDRISPNNLDIGSGAGTERYAPSSTALDYCKAALKKSEARRKVLFDLEKIAEGVKLPFRDNSFGSVTMVSVWQYLNIYPKLLLKEVERILSGDGKLFIIESRAMTKENLQVRSNYSGEIINYLLGHTFYRLEHNTLCMNGQFSEEYHYINCVTVHMPNYPIDLI